MSLPVILRPPTEADVEQVYQKLEARRAGLGQQFLVRLRKVLEQLESMPEIYGIVWQDVRAVRLKKFPFVVYYVVLVDRVEVLAVLHGSRDESAWKLRV